MARPDINKSAGPAVSRLVRIARALYEEPWLIEPGMHAKLCAIFEAHVCGTAHEPDGIVAQFEHSQADSRTAKANKETRDDIAVISIDGVIGHRFALMLKSSGVVSIDVAQDMIEQAAGDSNINGIVLDINSPGGTVAGVPEAGQAVVAAADKKPVVAHGNGMMASAAYWLAAGATAIYATPSTVIGSIGVYAAILDRSEEFAMKGDRVEVFTTGAYKTMGMPGTELTEKHREHIQAGVDQVFEKFKAAVLAKRTVSEDSMQGQTFFGWDAEAAGLIDRVGSFSDAIQECIDLTGA